MRLPPFALPILGAAAVLALQDIESVHRGKTSTAQRPLAAGLDTVLRAESPRVPVGVRTRDAPVIAAAPALAPVPSAPERTALTRGSDTAPQASGAVRARASAHTLAASRPLPQTPAAFESDEIEAAMRPVARLYLAYFQRHPDFQGFEYYIDEREGGRPLADIADEFAGSREFADRYGALDNAQFLDRIERNVGGEIDPEQRAQWLAQLDTGVVTRGQVMLALSESDGFREATGDEVYVAIGELLRARRPR